jgi:hypothetical protein
MPFIYMGGDMIQNLTSIIGKWLIVGDSYGE